LILPDTHQFLKLLFCSSDDLPEGCVKLEHVVTNLDWSSEDEIRVTCKIQNQEDKIFVADHIICTIPIGVLQKNHTSLFTPNLPNWKIKAINVLS
jgi:spermine oxidase